MDDQQVIDRFHELIYPRQGCTWLGVDMLKLPSDLWLYQEILAAQRPDLIVQCGTFKGGSALYLASICELLRHGHVLSIDINHWPGLPVHQRLTYLTGSSTDPQMVENVKGYASLFKKTMVILDSDHSKDHVLAELRSYWEIVTPGCYLIVEDGNIHGHPVRDDLGPGPYEALEEFSRENDHFTVDEGCCQRYLMTMNPRGYLVRTK